MKKAQLGVKHWNYGDGTKINKGYRLVKKPDHHFALANGYVYEHRLVYEEYHKCCLLPWVDIHHRNSKRLDNRIENLEAISHSDHIGLTHRKDMSYRKCFLCGSNKTRLNSKNVYCWMKVKTVTVDYDLWYCFKCYERNRKRKLAGQRIA